MRKPFGNGPFAAVVLSLALTGSASAEPAGEAPRTTHRVGDEVLRELRDSGALAQAIDEGIRRYVQQQQAARSVDQQRQARAAEDRAREVRPPTRERDHIFGNPDAEISLIEYSDFECPYCKQFHGTAKALVEAFDGKVNWVYRHFPLAFHNPGAQRQAEASECAAELGGNDAFWRYVDAVYERTRSGGNGFPLDQLVPLAVEFDLDAGRFRECLDSGRHAQRVSDQLREGVDAGVNGTPGNILRNNATGEVVLRPGARSIESLRADIEALLQRD